MTNSGLIMFPTDPTEMRIDRTKIECPYCKSEFDWADPFKGLLNEERKVIVRCKNCGSYLNIKISR